MKEKKEREKEKKKKAKQRKQNAKQQAKHEAEEKEIQAQKQLAISKKAEEDIQSNAGKCSFCEKSLGGIVPYEVFGRHCCSSSCVVRMRRKITADAAEKRLKSHN